MLARIEKPFANQALLDLGKGRTFGLGAQVILHLAGVAGILAGQLFQRGRALLLLRGLKAHGAKMVFGSFLLFGGLAPGFDTVHGQELDRVHRALTGARPVLDEALAHDR